MQEPVSTTQESHEEVAHPDAVSTASRLWTALDRMHSEANARARSDPQGMVTSERADLVNHLLRQSTQLLAENGATCDLVSVDLHRMYTNTELLLLLTAYRGALRDLRLRILKELPYSF